MFGDAASHFCCDDVCYGNTRMQNWVASHFGRHFVTHKPQVKYNIEAAAWSQREAVSALVRDAHLPEHGQPW